ncbi:MAG: DUF2752 domain-containing protein [Phycisphaerales bacterium]|mgnify:CR=1 FL=1|jgi:hypothetical protein|nr:hypothetical protein [Planctomycetaceae bacterium]MDP6157455.1 DUF2752 domain-containing protein [Phycisphaerales bacterium]MDP6312620.1 DUF2752 domain-containing protein [Phycisphaerales bacterium]MDP7086035.1 DUF2752 domain-containing protein [Phycisphaerales bacterium]MDP7188933.1 DUF2752 domain-containing protein [Phycisphaerales bacterium]|tara:strand:- start:5034 stop:5480 length:447 start_codon:yes stop_codon:yes gene_type:complete
MVGFSASRLSVRGRLLAAVVAVAAASPLVVAAMLTPSASGMGTHQALGLPACGWQTAMQLPCPSCGMTTAFAHASRADFGNALLAQPAGLLLSLFAALTTLGGLYAAFTAAPMQRLAATLVQPRIVWIGLAILLLGWLLKLSQAGIFS